MKPHAQSFCCLVLALGAAAGGTLSAAPAAPVQSSALKSGATNATPAEAEIPRSSFTMPASPKEGRDPFFPDSTRPYSTSITARTNSPSPMVALELKGISGTAQRRLAVINNHTFEAGEQGDVVTPVGRIQIRCVEIRPESVLVEVGGERRELQFHGDK